MDIEYANKCIDKIQEEFDALFVAHHSMKKHYNLTKYDIDYLEDLYTTIIKRIREYYLYLKSVDILPKDSYLTKWIDEHDIYEQLEVVQYFIQNEKKFMEDK